MLCVCAFCADCVYILSLFGLSQMADGQVQDGHRVLSARKRLGMVGVLAVVAGTAVFFNAEEQAAEMKIWDNELAGRRNGTALADQQNRRFVLGTGLSWTAAEDKCKALGAGICKKQAVCRYEEQEKRGNDMLKTGKKGGQKDKKGKNPGMRRVKQLCAGKGTDAALPVDAGKGNKKQRQKGGLKGLGSVCSENEKVELQSRWLPILDGGQHLWANVKTCDVKPSVPGEKEQAVVACCGTGAQSGKGKGLFAAVHPPVVIQVAEEMVKQRKQGKVGVSSCLQDPATAQLCLQACCILRGRESLLAVCCSTKSCLECDTVMWVTKCCYLCGSRYCLLAGATSCDVCVWRTDVTWVGDATCVGHGTV